MKKLCVLSLVALFLVSLVLVGCSSKEETTTTVAPETTTTAAAAVAINWDEAMDYEGQTATVAGPVVAVVDKGAGIAKYIIQIGSEGDDGFNATVEYASADKFGGAAALSTLVGKTVEVTGEVYVNSFELKAEILLTDAAQFAIVGDAPAGPAALTADEAKAHYGEEGSVTGTVAGVLDLGAGPDKWLIQLDSTEDGSGFNGMVAYANIDKFDDLNALVGKTVVLTGAIYENGFQKKGEIELLDPSQLVVQ